MSLAKVIEITATSKESFEAAIRDGIAKASQTVDNIEGAWIKEQKVEIQNNKVVQFRVDMKVTFVVQDK